jgi:RNA polymerase sigma factor (sigma-70 family)
MSEAIEKTDTVTADTTSDQRKRVDDAWAAVQTGLHYVSWLSREFAYTGIAKEDLEEEGRLGLFEAALRFDPDNGAQFLTYASWWARRRMQTFVARHARVVRRPAPRVGAPRAHDDVSLDQPVGGGSPLRWEDVLVDRQTPRALDAIVGAENAALIAATALELPPQWREIIVRRYGLDGEQAMTLAAVGVTLGLSRERVRQIEAKAIERLRARIEVAWGRVQRGVRRERERARTAANATMTLRILPGA